MARFGSSEHVVERVCCLLFSFSHDFSEGESNDVFFTCFSALGDKSNQTRCSVNCICVVPIRRPCQTSYDQARRQRLHTTNQRGSQRSTWQQAGEKMIGLISFCIIL